MKALPKRKGNFCEGSEDVDVKHCASMKALPKRKGNSFAPRDHSTGNQASMKALPKRKGNETLRNTPKDTPKSLNESPSEKEGKYRLVHAKSRRSKASMKALPKRKGNTEHAGNGAYQIGEPQ